MFRNRRSKYLLVICWTALHASVYVKGNSKPLENEIEPLKRMGSIELKSREDKERVDKYLSQLAGIEIQPPLRQEGPIAEKYEAVGGENLDLLLKWADRTSWENPEGVRWYLEVAIEHVVSATNKQVVLRALPEHKQLVRPVVKFGWEKDCRGTLIAGLRDAIALGPTGYLSADWIQAIANLNDAANYSLLTQFIARGPDKPTTVRICSKLADFDTAKAVRLGWDDLQTRKNRNAWNYYQEYCQFAPIAAEYGIRDALDFCFDYFNGREHFDVRFGKISEDVFQQRKDWIRRGLVDILDVNPDEIPNMARQRSELVYQSNSRRWTLPGQVTTSSSQNLSAVSHSSTNTPPPTAAERIAASTVVLIQPVSLSTSNGIVTLQAGTRVPVVGGTATTLRIQYGNQQFDIPVMATGAAQ